jgi:hypothetical protein
MSEEVKQEGSFKLQKPKPTPRKLNKPAVVAKVDLQTKTEENAVQEQTTNESVLGNEVTKVELPRVDEGNAEPTIITQNNDPQQEEVIQINALQEISEEEKIKIPKEEANNVVEKQKKTPQTRPKGRTPKGKKWDEIKGEYTATNTSS